MKVIPLEETTMTLPELVRLAEGGSLILTRGGRPIVTVKDVSGSDWESTSLANNPRFTALIEESRRSYRDRGGVSMADLRREFGLEEGPSNGIPDASP